MISFESQNATSQAVMAARTKPFGLLLGSTFGEIGFALLIVIPFFISISSPRLASAASPTYGAKPGKLNLAKGSNRMSGFKYQTCSELQCVEVVSDEAKLSFIGGGFTTKGPTKLIIREKNGEVVSTLEGISSSFQAQVGLLNLDLNETGSFAIYSLRDEKLSVYGTPTQTSKRETKR